MITQEKEFRVGQIWDVKSVDGVDMCGIIIEVRSEEEYHYPIVARVYKQLMVPLKQGNDIGIISFTKKGTQFSSGFGMTLDTLKGQVPGSYESLEILADKVATPEPVKVAEPDHPVAFAIKKASELVKEISTNTEEGFLVTVQMTPELWKEYLSHILHERAKEQGVVVTTVCGTSEVIFDFLPGVLKVKPY